MNYLRVKNWEEFQHYKDRSPPWIKLHRTLLDDYEFSALPDDTKAHLMLIWVLASQLGGRVPAEPKFLAAKIGANKPPNLKLLVDRGFLLPEQNASSTQAERKQEASDALSLVRSQEERREETEERQRRGEEGDLPNQTHRSLATSLGVDCEAELARYRDYLTANGKRHRNEAAGFRNWLRKAAEFKPKGDPRQSVNSEIWGKKRDDGRDITGESERVA